MALTFVLLIAAASSPVTYADCSPSSWGPDTCVFGSHMVLASSDAWSGGVTPSRVWGTSLPSESITLSGLPAGATVAPSNPWLADSSGNWSIEVSATASLIPANLTFSGSNGSQVVLADVLFGHTFLCSGQSNMDFPVICSFDADAAYNASLSFPEIRLMNAGLSDGNPGVWYSAANTTSNSSVEDFSATCYYTALALKRNVPALAGVPLGLVRASVGGQVIERFIAENVLLAEGLPAPNASSTSCDQSSHTLFDSLIEPLAPFVFKSMIFYHGEGNVGCNIQPSPDWEVGPSHALHQMARRPYLAFSPLATDRVLWSFAERAGRLVARNLFRQLHCYCHPDRALCSRGPHARRSHREWTACVEGAAGGRRFIC